MTKLSQRALEKCSDLIEQIKSHPFNQELASGSLNPNIFAYYIAQDVIYLQSYSQSLAIIASKSPAKFASFFTELSNEGMQSEQEIVHLHSPKLDNLKLTNATIAYTNYLLEVTSCTSIEIGIAAILPCCWVYKIVGNFIANQATSDNNPYEHWIHYYSGEEFDQATIQAIDIFDELAESASEETQNLMLDAFYTSTLLEWHFWNDAYNSINLH